MGQNALQENQEHLVRPPQGDRRPGEPEPMTKEHPCGRPAGRNQENKGAQAGLHGGSPPHEKMDPSWVAVPETRQSPFAK